MDGREAADGGDEGEEEVLDDEAPGEQADDRADLVADDRAEADADRAPERDAGERAEQEQRGLAAVERVVDAAAGEDGVADREAEPFADEAEDDAGEQPGGELGADHARAFGREQEGGADRAEAVFAGHEHDPGERGEDAGEAADARAGRAGPRCSSGSALW